MVASYELFKIEKALKSVTVVLVAVSVVVFGLNLKSVPDLKPPQVMGAGDTTHTWQFTAASASQFTYNSSEVTIDNSGGRVRSDLTLLSNSTFDSNINSWTLNLSSADADAQTYWNAMSTPPTQGRKPLDNEFFLALKSSGVWSELDEMWVFAHETQQAALLGIKRYKDATAVGGANLNFTANSGFQRQASTAYINTNFTPSTHGVNFLINDSSFGVYSRTNMGTGNYDMGTASATNTSVALLASRWSVPVDSTPMVVVMHENASDVQDSGSVTNSIGFFVARRNSSTTRQGFKNGVLNLERSTNSVALSNQPFFVGGINIGGSPGAMTTRRYATAFVGSAMTTTQQSDFYTAFNSYLTQIDATYSANLATYQSGTTYGGSTGAARIVANKYAHNFYQDYNAGSTQQYLLSTYAYTDGSAVTSADAQLYHNGSAISTTYTSVGGGWYRLSALITGVNASVSHGVQVKANKTVYLDNIQLQRANGYNLYTTNAYANSDVVTWDSLQHSATIPGSSTVRYQVCANDGSVCEGANSWQYWDGDSWETASNTTTHTNLISDFNENNLGLFPIINQKFAVKVIMNLAIDATPVMNSIQLALTTDTTPPPTNATNTQMQNTSSGYSVTEGAWANNAAPYFSWTAGADDPSGSGIRGYCLYLGSDSAGDPETSKGLLGTSQASTAGSTCAFVIADVEIDFSTLSYRGTPWLVSDTSQYYLNIKAIDNAGLVYQGTSESFAFRYDDSLPTNVNYISSSSGTFSSIADMNFSWPTNGSAAASDAESGLLGWQYAINGTSTWFGTQTNATYGLDYIPVGSTQPHFLDETIDGSSVVIGDNVVYFRTVDIAGNPSSPSTYRTGNLAYGGDAPSFPGDAAVTINPASNTSNSFALSWPAALPTSGNTIDSYYYMINTVAPATLSTLTGNSATYIPTDNLSVSAGLLPGAQKGSNQVRVVAVDNEGNYSPSNAILGTFTLNSSNPDPAQNLSASDASVKAASLWRAALAWDDPTYQGTGVLTYIVERSDNGSAWLEIARTTGNAYVDTVAQSRAYYWRIGTIDTSDDSIASPSYTNAVVLTPKGAYTQPANLTSGPEVENVASRRATINWTTDRTSDTKIAYGTKPGEYNPAEVSNSQQVTAHSIVLNNLQPGTTYYYIAKWTDEDGNNGQSEEKAFATQPPPSVKDVKVSGVNLSAANITYTVKGASAVKIYYGLTTEFGGMQEVLTSSATATYTSSIASLQDGQKYYFKVNPLDNEGTEYQGTILDFTTLPRPRVSSVTISQVVGSAQPAIKINWLSNTEISSIISYYPVSDQSQSRDQVDLDLLTGEHEMIIENLLPETTYELVVKGHDLNGNQAASDVHRFTTASDTRPPQIYDLRIEGGTSTNSSSLSQGSQAQLIVSWKTDEPATSQVLFGEGSGGSYLQSTQREENLKTNHLVVISGLSPSKVYHLQALSLDSASNETASENSTVITPKAPDSALYLVFRNLLEIFGFLE